MSVDLLNTPLHQQHLDLNARMVDYAGWSMPVMYKGILDEARSVRSSAGIFDISHMGRLVLMGEHAADILQRLTSNDIARLDPGHAHYSLLTNEEGGIVDDIIVYREAMDRFLVVINASNTDKDITWIRKHIPQNASSRLDLIDRTLETAMIAVQGPRAAEILAEATGDGELGAVKRFEFRNGRIGGRSAIFCRTGYTGEDGFEVIIDAPHAPPLWRMLLKAGAEPCGLGARDTLRIEAGYPLYGHEIDDRTDPFEAGLGWVVKLDKGAFVGSDRISEMRRNAPIRRLVGLVSAERIQPRQGYTVLADGVPVGAVTSGTFSPVRNCSIAMAYIACGVSAAGREVEIVVREKRIRATVVLKKNLLS